MTSKLTNSLSTKNYTIFISSNDKVSGTNNNVTYQTNWMMYYLEIIHHINVLLCFKQVVVNIQTDFIHRLQQQQQEQY